MELQELLPLQEKGDLFLIQTQIGPEDADCLRRSAIRSLAGDIADFEDSAAIVEQLDLVVTVDTSLAHLAGALGRPKARRGELSRARPVLRPAPGAGRRSSGAQRQSSGWVAKRRSASRLSRNATGGNV